MQYGTVSRRRRLPAVDVGGGDGERLAEAAAVRLVRMSLLRWLSTMQHSAYRYRTLRQLATRRATAALARWRERAAAWSNATVELLACTALWAARSELCSPRVSGT